jgi:hypothetical protein
MENQVTYIKRLDSVTSTNSEVIANLSNIVKDVVIKSHESFKEITRDVMWLNVTLHGMSELYILIRQLEFSILKLHENLNELLGALDCVLLGKLPVSLVSPHTLHNLLGYVSRKWPEGYEWVFGSRYADFYKYYEIIQVAVLGNTNAIKIVLNVPLKTVNREFALYKLFALPSLISNTTSVHYKPSFRYFAFSEIQHRYALLIQAEVDHCIGGNVAICPADTAINFTRVVTCESSLYFQTLDTHRLCQRQILQQPSTPTWTRHGTVWIYHISEPLEVTFRCLVNQTWTSKTKKLAGNGLVLQTSRCFILTEAFVVPPALTGGSEFNLEAPVFYVPDKVGIVAEHELLTLADAVPPAVAQIDKLMTVVSSPHMAGDVSTMMQFHHLLTERNQQRNWYTISLAVVATVTLIILLVLIVRPHYPRLVSLCCTQEKSQKPQEFEKEQHGAPTTEQVEADTSGERPAQGITVYSTYRMTK